LFLLGNQEEEDEERRGIVNEVEISKDPACRSVCDVYGYKPMVL